MVAVTFSGRVRDTIVDLVELDLIGPTRGLVSSGAKNVDPVEILADPPSRYYLAGFLVPKGALPKLVSADDSEDLESEAETGSGDDASRSDRAAASTPRHLPASIGLTVLLAPGGETVEVEASWGDYVLSTVPDPEDESGPAESGGRREEGAAGEDSESSDGGKGVQKKLVTRWTRKRRAETRTVSLREGREDLEIPNSSGPLGGALQLVRLVRRTRLKLANGEQDVLVCSFFLVNRRAPLTEEDADMALVFQAELTVRYPGGFLARPDMRGYFAAQDDWDARLSDLHYRDVYEFAVGHGCSVAWIAQGLRCTEVSTTFMPRAGVPRVVPNESIAATFGMEELGKLKDGAAARAALVPLVDAYRDWIKAEGGKIAGLDARRQDIAKQLIANASAAADRIADGILILETQSDALEAFRIANRAIGRSARKRRPNDTPIWRPFQLAFVLLNLRGVATPTHPDRAIADLLFFPTGGGKTEAYLGLAAFVMVLRRLRNPGLLGAGVAVIMRYTLRLLTLDPLGRAAAVMCALELERADPAYVLQKDGRTTNRLGDWPFEVGLWVGRAATPNRMGGPGDPDENCAYRRVMRFLAVQTKESPIPIKNCPWCNTKFGRSSFKLTPNRADPRNIEIYCDDRNCDFAANTGRALPIVAVDEPIYRRLPAFLIATVDKFASLPWVGETASFFGRANRFDNAGFYGPAEPGQGYPLGEELMPPDLVIQDELHLISGPLGSIAGIYETAIDRLCARKRPNGQDGYAWVRPKLVASTATVRRAASQVKALFGRAQSSVFPPPGVDRTDSFFALTSPVTESDPRLYVGLAAQGRSPKVIFLRTMLSSMAAAYLQWIANGGRAKDAGTGKNKLNPADPYLTSLCYFNALKELGAARRIVEGEVQAPLSNYGMRRKRVSEAAPILGNRPIKQLPEELTSRISNDEVAEAKRKLEIRFDADGKAYEDAVDVALATNMISVGLDIPRLGQMVVSGQPKAAAEYIQATSRVGRDADKPGLVFALLNIHRPRDRSHYEHFATFHAAFYRAVEAATVAPFVPRSLDRALAAAVVAMARLEDDQLTPERTAIFARDAAPGFPTFAKEFRDRADASGVDLIGGGAGVESRATEILNAWVRLSTSATAMGYADRKGGKRLLKEMLGAEAEISDPDELLFRSPRSMRDVEPEVRLKVRTLKGVDVGD